MTSYRAIQPHPEIVHPDWMERGLCAGYLDEHGAAARDAMWFPERGHNAPGKAVCAACPVRRRCLDYAIDHDIRVGIWGGKSPKERFEIELRRRTRR